MHLRERVAVPADRILDTANRLKAAAGLSEVVVLSTCNRVEIYGAFSGVLDINQILNTLTTAAQEITPHIYTFTADKAAHHLFSVASGLDSMVLGETEITGQVKNAYETAQKLKLTGRVTNNLFQKALQTAKTIRTNTQIGRGATSVGSVAVQLAEKIFDTRLHEKTAAILGAGQMGEACLRHLAKKGVASITVINRSLERAQKLSAEFGGKAASLDDCHSILAQTDIVVAAAGGETLLTRSDVQSLMQQRQSRPLFFIDIAVPRNIDPEVQALENVFLYNVDHLDQIVQENVRLREQELARCQIILGQAVSALMAKLDFVPQKPTQGNETPQPGWALRASTAYGYAR